MPLLIFSKYFTPEGAKDISIVMRETRMKQPKTEIGVGKGSM